MVAATRTVYAALPLSRGGNEGTSPAVSFTTDRMLAPEMSSSSEKVVDRDMIVSLYDSFKQEGAPVSRLLDAEDRDILDPDKVQA